MKSSLKLTDLKEILPKRRDRSSSIQVSASGRRNNIHAVTIGLLSQKRTPSIIEDYTSRARKSYRERRASYYKQVKSKHKTDFTTGIQQEHIKTDFTTGIQQEHIKPLDRFRKIVRMSLKAEEYEKKRACFGDALIMTLAMGWAVLKQLPPSLLTIKNSSLKSCPLDPMPSTLVIILKQAFKNIVFYASERGKHDEITSETAMTLKATAKGTVADLMFNPEEYKTDFKNTFPRWAIIVTTKLPEERTDEEIRLLIRLLKQLKGFRRYSPEVQLSMCRVLKYDVYNRTCVIIRKGHVAQRLYFIFSGSVRVTVDNDKEHSMISQQSSGETSVLQRGDYFGELAFLKNFRRGATIVCLERTELLSMDKEDFFLSGIDKTFTRDLERRVDFISNHPIFATWPASTIKSIAEICRIHEYHSEEVLVRDSNKSGWLFLIIKGECDIVRLLDLSACDSYIKHQNRYRGSSVGHTSRPSQSINLAGYLSSNSSILKPLITASESTEEDDDVVISSSISEINIHSSDVGEVASRNRTKSACSRTTRCFEDKSSERGFSVADSVKRRNTKEEKSGSLDIRNATGSEDVGVGVYMVVDKLKPGQLFGARSFINQAEEGFRIKTPVDKRRLSLISRGCEIIKISKEGFQKLANSESIATMKRLTRNYPSDEKLCRTYLKLSDWRSYREELVENVLVKKMKEHEMAMGLWRTQITRAPPAPSPLCSVKPWQPVNSKWEYFPRSGWEVSKVTQPVIQAGEKRKIRKTSKASKTTRMTTQTRGRGKGPHQTKPCSSIKHPETLGMSRQVSMPRHSPLPIQHHSSRYPQNSQPLIGDKLVIAKGSQRALILTHGGIRCNEFIREVEQSIV